MSGGIRLAGSGRQVEAGGEDNRQAHMNIAGIVSRSAAWRSRRARWLLADWRHRSVRGVLAAGLFLVLGAVGPHGGGGFDETQATGVFTEAYEGIENYYLEKLSAREIALTGLTGLSKIDPDLAVTRVDSSVRLLFGDTTSYAFPAPQEHDIRGWVNVTTSVVKYGRDISDRLRAASAEDIYETIFDTLLSDLDRFSRYAGTDDARDNRAVREGFGGIGVRVRAERDGIRVIEVIKGTPAFKGGVREDDMIMRVDTESTRGWTQRRAVDRLRGRMDSTVRLSLKRAGGQRFNIRLNRDHIVLPTVFYTRQGRIGILRIEGFNLGTSRSFTAKLAQAQRDIGTGIQGVIIDLRGNPGGLLEQAIAMADSLIAQPDMRILTTQGRHAASFQSYKSTRPAFAHTVPIVVLINGASASAAEILAAALQDTGRAVLVGSVSYGKGSVQTVITMPNEGELTLTWARLHAPSGYSFHEVGVMPSVCTLHGGRDPKTVLTAMLRDRVKIAQVARDRHRATGNPDMVEKVRSFCDGKTVDPNRAMAVALSLLQRPDLYDKARALVFSSVATAAGARITQ